MDKTGRRLWFRWSCYRIVCSIGIFYTWQTIPDYLGSLGVEYSLRPTSTDNIDGISTAVDPDDNDWLSTIAVVVGLPIGKGAPDSDNDNNNTAEGRRLNRRVELTIKN